MIEVISALILYLVAFPCLYGIIRTAVRDGVDDASRLATEREADAPREPALPTLPPTLTTSG
jgi:hypothetical protein